MKRALVILISLMIMPSLSGCFGNEDYNSDSVTLGAFDFGEIPKNVWYHYSFKNETGIFHSIDATNQSAVSSTNITVNLTGNNTPFYANGTYYGIGMTTFEPTIGATSADNLYMTSWGNGEAGSTAIVRCSGMINMVNIEDYICEDVYSVAIPVPNSNDPYVYVDPWTDRIMKFDMHALLGMTVEWSDDEGQSWIGPSVATGWAVQDHQTIASSPYSAIAHETTWVFCVNGGYPYPVCSASENGGVTWGPELPGAPADCNSGGLTGHLIGSENGNFYRGNPGCNGEGYSIYRSTDGGISWTEHPLPTEETGTADTWNFEEAQIAADSENNLHSMWMGLDNMPYYAYSTDNADSWSEPLMIAPPANLNGTGFPVITAGGVGKVAFGYIGDSGGDTWNGYLTVVTDAFNENPLFTTVQVNDFEDPLDISAGCGYNRCGGFGDFNDIIIDQYGRPWFGLAHNVAGEIGIFGTMTAGPSLRDEPLTEVPIGGPSTV